MRFAVKALFLAAAAGWLAACTSPGPALEAARPTVRHQYVIDVQPNIALHRAYNDDGHTYLEFLDARRMNPVVTTVDGTALPYAWTDRLLVLEGVYDNLTVTTPHGVAHVYARMPAPPARVAAPVPARALEYGAPVPAVRPPAPDNYGDAAELPARGDATTPDRISVVLNGSFSESLGEGRARQLVAASREASRVTIGAAVARGGHLAEARAYSRIAEARQFLIDNGVPAERIRTTRAVVGGARDSQVDFVIAY